MIGGSRGGLVRIVSWLAVSGVAGAQVSVPVFLAEHQAIPLWSHGAPGALGSADADVPTITAYFPDPVRAPLPAVVVCPGGSYRGVATAYEGREAQEYLNSIGVAVFLLQYRVGPRYHYPIELMDAQRAMRMVRTHAREWGLDPHRIGIMGFSAGGHLASTVSTHFDADAPNVADSVDRASSRPDFAILIYPVISMTAPWTHQGSKHFLLGDSPDSAVAHNVSNDLMVTSQTPPTFLVHTDGDSLVPAENSVSYYLALRKAGVPAELHIFQNGRHGLALGMGDAVFGEWPRVLANWLQTNGWLR
jgi:acetyl esterase/lipase